MVHVWQTPTLKNGKKRKDNLPPSYLNDHHHWLPFVVHIFCPSPLRVAPAELRKIEPSPAGAGKTWAPQHHGWTSLREGNVANVMGDDGWK